LLQKRLYFSLFKTHLPAKYEGTIEEQHRCIAEAVAARDMGRILLVVDDCWVNTLHMLRVKLQTVKRVNCNRMVVIAEPWM